MAKEARVLNRIVRLHPRQGIACETDRHAEIFIRDTGAENSKTISKHATKDTGREAEQERRQD